MNEWTKGSTVWLTLHLPRWDSSLFFPFVLFGLFLLNFVLFGGDCKGRGQLQGDEWDHNTSCETHRESIQVKRIKKTKENSFSLWHWHQSPWLTISWRFPILKEVGDARMKSLLVRGVPTGCLEGEMPRLLGSPGSGDCEQLFFSDLRLECKSPELFWER